MELFGTAWLVWTLLSLLALLTVGYGARDLGCKRKPPHSTFQPSDSTGDFVLEVPELSDSDQYLPEQQYEVTLHSVNDRPFTAFMVWPEGEEMPDARNPYRAVSKASGYMHPYADQPVKLSDVCINTIENVNAANVLSVKMYWKSPPRGNGCVTLHAMVAENDEVYYKDGSGLTIKICEDNSFMEDKSSINEDCDICEEAKYELTFEGKWSRNTHPHKFPADDFSVYYGDMIGASHSLEYTMWKDGSDPSEAMTQLALYNNTMPFEEEILSNYSLGYIRTLIKGKGHGRLNGELSDPTYAIVRVDKRHHLISTATALRPSPDWFLGVSDYELCQTDNTWLPTKTINLIPWDAGVSKGISYESPYDPSNDLIGRVRVGSFDSESAFYNMNYKQVKPFATLTMRLIRTYPSMCEEQNPEDGEQTLTKDSNPGEEQPEAPSRQTSPLPHSEEESSASEESDLPASISANTDDDCPLSEWEEWTPCSGQCGESGYRFRSRNHIVNGVEYRYYKPGEKIPSGITEPSDECIRRHENDRFMTEPCQRECSDNIQPRPYKADYPYSRRRRAIRTYEGRRNQIASRVFDVIDSSTWTDSGPQDCVMSSWSRWGACSGSCGEGRQKRARYVVRQSRNGGQSCPTAKLKVRTCNLYPCFPHIL